MTRKKKRPTKRRPAPRRAPSNLGTFAVPMRVADLVPHPRNYRTHPEEQLQHLEASLRAHGCYRNVVVARGRVILAGHGLVLAAQRVGLTHLPVLRLDLAPTDARALAILAGDNEIPHLASVDDRALEAILHDLQGANLLLGVGYDEASLQALALSVPQAPIVAAHDPALDDWDGSGVALARAPTPRLVVLFRSPEQRQEFADRIGVVLTDASTKIWWPALVESSESARAE